MGLWVRRIECMYGMVVVLCEWLSVVMNVLLFIEWLGVECRRNVSVS